MPEIIFFEPARFNADYTMKGPDTSMIALGGWAFHKRAIEIINGDRIGNIIGYKVTYHNEEISQEETDRLWQRYLQETGQG